MSAQKTVIITGASGGLGTAVTKTFLQKGYRVIAIVGSEKSKSTLDKHDALDVQVVDLGNEQQAGDFVKTAIERYGKIDAALLLAGGFAMGGISETNGEDIRKQLSINFDTAYFITHPLFDHMLANNNGRIVFIGARPALQAAQGKNLVAYSLSKSLLFRLAEYINETAKGKNVTATVVVPSTIDTAVNRQSMPDANFSNWVQPEALAEIIEFAIGEHGQSLREPVLKVYNNA